MILIRQLPKDFKKLIAVFTIMMTLGVSLGILYVQYNTQLTPNGTSEQYGGSPEDDMGMREKYPKPYGELLVTSHNHVRTFSLIFGVMGVLALMTNFKWKLFLFSF